MQPRLDRERVSWACRVVGEAVRLSSEVLQSRRGMRLERDKKISVYNNIIFSSFSFLKLGQNICVCVVLCAFTCSRADCTAGLWRPPSAAGEAEGEKPGTWNDSKPGNPLLPGGWSPPLNLEYAHAWS